MRRHASGQALTGSGSTTSSTTEEAEGNRVAGGRASRKVRGHARLALPARRRCFRRAPRGLRRGGGGDKGGRWAGEPPTGSGAFGPSSKPCKSSSSCPGSSFCRAPPRAAARALRAACRQAISLRSVHCFCQRASAPARRASAVKASPPARPGRAHPSHRQVARLARLRAEWDMASLHLSASAPIVGFLLYS